METCAEGVVREPGPRRSGLPALPSPCEILGVRPRRDISEDPLSVWLPFTATELQVVLGVLGVIAAALSYASFDPKTVLITGAAYLVVFYLAGLLVQARRQVRVFEFLENGGIRGDGYIPYFRAARRSLFLIHADDDSPSDELLAVYRNLLDRGVELRRVLFLREGAAGVTWVARFGDHQGLLQKAILPDQAQVMRFSFVVVDEELVILSVPGFGPLDDGSYSPTFVLRHLLLMHDAAVARVFLRMHGDLWSQGVAITSADDLADPGRFVLRAKGLVAA